MLLSVRSRREVIADDMTSNFQQETVAHFSDNSISPLRESIVDSRRRHLSLPGDSLRGCDDFALFIITVIRPIK